MRGSSSAAEPPDGRGGEGTGAERWLPAAWKAAVLLIAAVVGFMIVPDRLVAYLSLHVISRIRDAIVLLWSVTWFVALSVVLVRLQRSRGV